MPAQELLRQLESYGLALLDASWDHLAAEEIVQLSVKLKDDMIYGEPSVKIAVEVEVDHFVHRVRWTLFCDIGKRSTVSHDFKRRIVRKSEKTPGPESAEAV